MEKDILNTESTEDIEPLKPLIIQSIAYFLSKRELLGYIIQNNKNIPYLKKKETVLEFLKSFGYILKKLKDVIPEQEWDNYIQLAGESLSDIGIDELKENKIDETIKLILKRTYKMNILISNKFKPDLKQNGKELVLRMTEVGNSIEPKKKEYKENTIIHFSKRNNMSKYNLLAMFSKKPINKKSKQKGKLFKALNNLDTRSKIEEVIFNTYNDELANDLRTLINKYPELTKNKLMNEKMYDLFTGGSFNKFYRNKIPTWIRAPLNFDNEPQQFHDKEAPLQSKLRFDIQDELEAIREYDEHIDSTNDKRVQDVLTHIRDEEKQHVGELSALVDMVDPKNQDLYEKGYEEANKIAIGMEEYFSSMSDFFNKKDDLKIADINFTWNKEDGTYQGDSGGLHYILSNFKEDKRDLVSSILRQRNTYINSAKKEMDKAQNVQEIDNNVKEKLKYAQPKEIYIDMGKGNKTEDIMNFFVNIMLLPPDTNFSYSVIFQGSPLKVIRANVTPYKEKKE